MPIALLTKYHKREIIILWIESRPFSLLELLDMTRKLSRWERVVEGRRLWIIWHHGLSG